MFTWQELLFVWFFSFVCSKVWQLRLLKFLATYTFFIQCTFASCWLVTSWFIVSVKPDITIITFMGSWFLTTQLMVIYGNINAVCSQKLSHGNYTCVTFLSYLHFLLILIYLILKDKNTKINSMSLIKRHCKNWFNILIVYA